ncbi:MAG: metalloregulator ArsR/SmtB family transcription factor [Actinobacteria bacterium]|nr:metalloregulator ArsR/SmtB family transcription factor [Actinomycetota bacterium]MBU1608846.1 metalloregulator ArsR/SmtB family transcription factor [Actinomycetota bacterium]MBU2314563.1 metalloregulator ArsR/SmtB family transcription factor [Actinomycetota bacterium]MBU2384242.1 metalloregulator ArsR/SmtB family transcription factor [Actinomycetota bacterium]
MVTRTRELSDADVDAIFHALADRTRRDIVARVIEREQSVSALAERYAMSFAAVQKHVAVLQKAALVRKVRDGRQQIVHAEVERLRRAQQLLDRYERLWRHRVDRMASILEEEGP